MSDSYEKEYKDPFGSNNKIIDNIFEIDSKEKYQSYLSSFDNQYINDFKFIFPDKTVVFCSKNILYHTCEKYKNL